MVAVVVEEVAGQRAHGVGAQAASVERWIDVEVDAGVSVDGVFRRLPLDGADDPVCHFDHQQVQFGGDQIIEDLGRQVVSPGPPRLDLGGGSNRDQGKHVRRGRRAQRDRQALQHGHPPSRYGAPTASRSAAPGDLRAAWGRPPRSRGSRPTAFAGVRLAPGTMQSTRM
jgi:hypothetical protein